MNFVVKCEALSLEKNFHEKYFGHVFFKACQYATNDENVSKGFKYVFIKSPKQIFRNASLGQRNSVKATMNGTKLTLKLV
jgi:hypothetical protein